MKAYSEDLRSRIVAAVGGGMPRSAAARVFGVGRATVKRYLVLRRQTGALAPRPRHGPPPIKTAGLRAALPARLEAAPDATLAEHCAWYEATDGGRVVLSARCPDRPAAYWAEVRALVDERLADRFWLLTGHRREEDEEAMFAAIAPCATRECFQRLPGAALYRFRISDPTCSGEPGSEDEVNGGAESRLNGGPPEPSGARSQRDWARQQPDASPG